MKQYSQRISIFWAVTYLFTSSLAFAHTGVGETHGSLAGLAHPFSGFDHWVAMIAVGLWAAQLGGRATWMVPLSFVSVMAMSAILSMFIAPIPFIEGGITLSILLLGLLIAAAVRLPILLSAVIVGIFALFHGFAHGSEMPANSDALIYTAGFITSTVLLHLVGVGIAIASRNGGHTQWLRYSGALVVACGCATLTNIKCRIQLLIVRSARSSSGFKHA
ncbi:MAG: HupE/UreJ family protein [Sideroxydans sp.]|nr:HupE/UreJ family protein [Sideroxydans sp.]